jgi:hypothetical protein
MQKIKLIALLVLGACSDEVKDSSSETTRTPVIENYQNLLSNARFNKGKLTFSILPSETIINLPNNAELEISESSFIDLRGDKFTDSVMIELNYIKDFDDYLTSNQTSKLKDIENLKYLFEFSVKSKNGEQIYMDKYDYPKLRFHPSENLKNTFYGVYDSSRLKWVLPVHQDIKSTIVSTIDSSYSKVTDHMNNDEVYYIDSLGNRVLPKRHTKTELMSYHINMKYSGFYYIGKNNGKDNQHIKLDIKVNCVKNLDPDTTHLYLMMEDQGYKYYHKANRLSPNMYSFNYPLFDSGIILNTNTKHKLFAYIKKSGNYYFYYNAKLKLDKINQIDIELIPISEKELINIIKSIK